MLALTSGLVPNPGHMEAETFDVADAAASTRPQNAFGKSCARCGSFSKRHCLCVVALADLEQIEHFAAVPEQHSYELPYAQVQNKTPSKEPDAPGQKVMSRERSS